MTVKTGNRELVHDLDQRAEAAGLSRGMALVDARALVPGLRTAPADLLDERQGLQALIRWAGRYSPILGADGRDGLVADLTGAAHLFGGEAALLQDLARSLGRLGFDGRAAIAPNRGSAWALARHGGGGLVDEGGLRARLAGLPLAALRLDPETVDSLARLGLRSIGDLAGVPRAPLVRRFGPGIMLRLDQALGRQDEPLSPLPPPPHFAVRMGLPEPIGLLRDVEAGLMRLLERLSALLLAAAQGARTLRLELRRVDRADIAVEVGLARPMRDPARIAALFHSGLQEVDAGFGIEALRLVATLTEPMPPEQLGEARQGGQDALDDLVTRLGNRLGFDNIRRFLPAESHIPEKSFIPMGYAHSRPETWPRETEGRERPLWLCPPQTATGAEGPLPPAAFRWRGMRLTTAQATGPERIAPEWWLDDPAWRSGLRDYWKVETHQGRRLWLYHTPQDGAWAVHGEFA